VRLDKCRRDYARFFGPSSASTCCYQLRWTLKKTVDAFGDRRSFSSGFAFVVRFRLSPATAGDACLVLDALVFLLCASDDDEVAVMLTNRHNTGVEGERWPSDEGVEAERYTRQHSNIV